MKTNIWNVKTALCAVMMSAAVLVGCDKDDAPANTPQDTLIDKVELPSATEPFVAGTAITIKGEGFTSEDKIIFRATTTRATEIEAEIVEVTAISITFKVPTGLTAGENSLVLKRGEVEQVLGSINIGASEEVDNRVRELMSYIDKPMEDIDAIMRAKGYTPDTISYSDEYIAIEYIISSTANEKEYYHIEASLPSQAPYAKYVAYAMGGNNYDKRDAYLAQHEEWADMSANFGYINYKAKLKCRDGDIKDEYFFDDRNLYQTAYEQYKKSILDRAEEVFIQADGSAILADYGYLRSDIDDEVVGLFCVLLVEKLASSNGDLDNPSH
ncbi:MAG: hypothetical protein ACRC3G_01710 [Bacteroidales bacterium]